MRDRCRVRTVVLWVSLCACAAWAPSAPPPTTRPARPATRPAPPTTRPAETLLGDPAFRHGGTITCVVPVSSTSALTSARDGTVRLWDLRTGREIRRFSAPSKAGTLWHAALSPDRKDVLASGDGGVYRWRLATGAYVGEFASEQTVFRFAFTPDGKHLVEGCGRKLCVLRSYPDGKRVRGFTGHRDSIYGVAVSADGKTVITASDDESIGFWETGTGKLIRQMKESTGDVYTVVLSPDGRRIAACTAKKKVLVLEAASGKILTPCDIPKAAHCVAWSPDSARLAMSAMDDHLYVVRASDGKVVWDSPLPGGTNYGLTFTADGRHVLCGSDHLLCRYDAGTGKREYPAPGRVVMIGAVDHMAVVPAADGVCVAGSGYGFHAIDTKTGRIRGAWLTDRDVQCLAVRGRTDEVLVGTEKTGCHVVSARTGKILRSLSSRRDVRYLAVTPDGARAVVAGWGGDGGAGVFDLATGKRRCLIRGGDDFGFVSGRPCVSVDGGRVAFAHDKGLHLWALPGGEFLQTIDLQGRPAVCLAFLPRGFLLGRKSWLSLFRAPSVTVRPIDKAEVGKLVAALGSAKYRTRAKATRRLIEAGPAVLDVLAGVRTADPEVRARLLEVRRALQGSTRKYADKHTLALPLGDGGRLAVHPDGRHWAALAGSEAGRTLVLGTIRDEKLQILQRVTTPHGPTVVQFDTGGALYVGNANGTVSRYAWPPR